MVGSAFRGDKLRLVREARGLSQDDLSRLSEIPQGSISKFESDIKKPDEKQWQRLADVLQVYPKFFARPELVLGAGLGEVFHRRRKMNQKTLTKIHARLNIVTLALSDLFLSVDQPQVSVPVWEDDEDPNLELLANSLRLHWYVPAGPIQNLSELLARAGIILVPFDFEGERIDAIGRWPLGLPPVIFYNPEVTDDRLRFTLAHELAHFCLHSGQSLNLMNRDLESEADGFASAFLMPEEDIRGSLRGLSITKLGSLKLTWKCSMASLITRAKQLGTISPRTAHDLWRQMSAYGYRTREPLQFDFRCEEPDLQFRKLISLHLNQLSYSVSELAERTGIREEEARKIYGMPSRSSGLWLVR